MKIIVTGCKGQLGTEILKQLREGRSEIGPIPEKLLNEMCIRDRSRPTISIKIKRITKFLKNFNFNATN